MVYLPFSYGLSTLTQPKTQEEELDEIRKDEETKHQKSLSSDKVLDTRSRAHLFAIGTTGSGKTANILRYVENSIKKRTANNNSRRKRRNKRA